MVAIRGERTLGDVQGDGRPPRRSDGDRPDRGSDRGSEGNRDGAGSAGTGGAGAGGSATGGGGASAGGAANGSSASGDGTETVGEAELDGDVLASLDTDIAAEAEEAQADA